MCLVHFTQYCLLKKNQDGLGGSSKVEQLSREMLGGTPLRNPDCDHWVDEFKDPPMRPVYLHSSASPVIENGQLECPQGYKRLNLSHCQGKMTPGLGEAEGWGCDSAC